MFAQSAPARWAASFSVVAVLAIFLAEWYLYHMHAQPTACWAVVFDLTLILAMWSYMQAALTDPGTPACPEWKAWAQLRRAGRSEEQWRKDAEEEYEATLGQEPRARQGWSPGKPSFCKVCRAERPERAHHCSFCGLCVLRMDHHCPWIGSCVGWRNHKYFILVTWWSFWACITFLLTLKGPDTFQAVSLSPGHLAHVNMGMLIGVMAVIVFLLLTGSLFVISLIAAMRNITTVEDLFSGDNPYGQETYLQNLEQLLGPADVRWLIPIACTSRCWDGTSYPQKRRTAQSAGSGEDNATSSYGSV